MSQEIRAEILKAILPHPSTGETGYSVLQEETFLPLLKPLKTLFENQSFCFELKAQDLSLPEVQPLPITQSHQVRERFIRQTSCPGTFAISAFEIHPLSEPRVIFRENLPERIQALDEPKTHCALLSAAAIYTLKACFDFVQVNQCTGFEVIWTEVLFHLTDSRPMHFYTPMRRVLNRLRQEKPL